MLAISLAALTLAQSPCDDQVIVPPAISIQAEFGRVFDVSRSRLLVAHQGVTTGLVTPEEAIHEYSEDPGTGSWIQSASFPLQASGLGRIGVLDLDRNTAVIVERTRGTGQPADVRRAFVLDRAPTAGTWAIGSMLASRGALSASIFGDNAVVVRRVAPGGGTQRLMLEHHRRTGGVWSLVDEFLLLTGSAFNLDAVGVDVQMDARFVAVAVASPVLANGLRMFRFDLTGDLVPLGGALTFGALAGTLQISAKLAVTVALEDELCVVGVPSVTNPISGNPAPRGATFSYRYAPVLDRWVRESTLSVSTMHVGADNGRSVALRDGRVAVSSELSTAGSSGLVRIFSTGSTGLLELRRELDAAAQGAPFNALNFGETIRIEGERLFASGFASQRVIVITPLSDSDCDMDGTTDSCSIILGTAFDTDRNGVPDDCASTGTRYCDPATPNSTGNAARIAYAGNAATALINENLYVEGLPVGSAGYFMASRTNGITVNPGAWLGALCLDGGPISRRVGGLRRADPDGRARALINRGALPGQAAGQLELILPGDTWYFQYWYVDPATSPMSNFSDAVQIDFTLF